jgi:hypothetical protein
MHLRFFHFVSVCGLLRDWLFGRFRDAEFEHPFVGKFSGNDRFAEGDPAGLTGLRTSQTGSEHLMQEILKVNMRQNRSVKPDDKTIVPSVTSETEIQPSRADGMFHDREYDRKHDIVHFEHREIEIEQVSRMAFELEDNIFGVPDMPCVPVSNSRQPLQQIGGRNIT